MSRPPSRATPEATAAFHARHPGAAGNTRLLDSLALSSIGIGTYLGPDDDATDALYAAAIARALEGGINVIDSASNYRSQRSERVIGAVLRQGIAAGRVRREELFVSSKVGYIPFDRQRPGDLPAFVAERYLAPGIVAREELVSGVHCMAPRYLDHVLDQSRANLGLDTIDLYYLHNPESGLEGVDRDQWLRRLRAAFETLERAACDGHIGIYGTATWNGYRKPPGAWEHHSLEALLAIAREVGGDHHHLRAVQLPYNLAMIEAATTPTQESAALGKLAPFLEVARAHGIYVMASASVLQGQLTRGLGAELERAIDEATPAANFSDAQRSIQFTRSTPGIGTALVGMKQLDHVDEATAIMSHAPLSAAVISELFARFGD